MLEIKRFQYWLNSMKPAKERALLELGTLNICKKILSQILKSIAQKPLFAAILWKVCQFRITKSTFRNSC